jgi:hypothetical protein
MAQHDRIRLGTHPRAIGALGLAALALLGAAAPLAAAPWDARLPALCQSLQQAQWGLPADIAQLAPDTQIETNLPGIMYLCNLGHSLPAADRGHAPDLGVLITRSDGDASVIHSANWFCEADRAPIVAALRTTMTASAQTLGVALPGDLLAALDAAHDYSATHAGIAFSIEWIAVDPDACAKVPPGGLGAVLGKVDVAIATPK